LKLKFQTVAEKTAKNFRGLLYFAAPGTILSASMKVHKLTYETMLAVELNHIVLTWDRTEDGEWDISEVVDWKRSRSSTDHCDRCRV